MVGLALGSAALWVRTDDAGGTYWGDGTFAMMLLTLLIMAALLLGASVLAAWRPFMAASGAVGLVLLGAYAFPPLLSTPDQVGSLREGAWLGVAGGALVAAGGVLAGWSLRPARRAPHTSATTVIPRAVAVVGAVLVVAAVWLKVFDIAFAGFSLSYWDLSNEVGGHHVVGVVMLALAVLAAVSTLVGLFVGPLYDAVGVVFGLVLLGFVLAFPVALAPQWSYFGAGAWLSVAGGALVAVGLLLSLLFRPSATATEVPASVPAIS